MLLFLDTETGGLHPNECSLLSLSADLVPTIGADPIDHFEVNIYHDIYKVSSAALQINGINLVQHTTTAVNIENARTAFSDWIWKYRDSVKLFTPTGWNIPFDLGFIHAQLFTRQEWFDLHMGYHTLDACSLAEVRIIEGKLPPRRRLVDVAKHFGLNTDHAHNASYDNYLCRKVLEKLVTL